MTDQPEESSKGEQVTTPLEASAAMRPTWAKRWRDWIVSRPVGLVVSVAALLLGPLILALVAGLLGLGSEAGMEAARLVYAWPVVTGTCIVVFVLVFREPLHRLISGVRRFKAAGLEMETEQRGLPQTDRDPRKKEIGWEEWFFELGKKLSPVDQQVIGDLGAIQREAFNRWIRWWWFEKIWGRIYGTQIGVVELLATKGVEETLELRSIIPLFDYHVDLLKASDTEFAKMIRSAEAKNTCFGHWIGFLESTYLIARRDGAIAKTPLTDEFTAYMRSQSYTRQMRIW